MEMQVQEAAEKIPSSRDKSRLSDCVRGQRQIHKHRSEHHYTRRRSTRDGNLKVAATTARENCPWDALALQEIYGVIYQGAAQDAVRFGQNVLQRFFHVLLGVGEGDYADGGGLPDVMKIQLGDGDVEFAAETVFQAAEDLALVF
jgi:hypothetical protein